MKKKLEVSETMEARKKRIWRHEATGVDGNTALFGVNIFDYEWRATGKTAKAPDPQYGQEREISIYTVIINGQEHEFAACEFSNCVWGFYVLND